MPEVYQKHGAFSGKETDREQREQSHAQATSVKSTAAAAAAAKRHYYEDNAKMMPNHLSFLLQLRTTLAIDLKCDQTMPTTIFMLPLLRQGQSRNQTDERDNQTYNFARAK